MHVAQLRRRARLCRPCPARSHASGLIAPALALAVFGAQAQTVAPPDAGALQRQAELERRAAAGTPGLAGAAARVQPPAPQPGAPTVTLRRIALRGATLLSDDALQAALAPWRGRPLDFAGLRSAADAVMQAYMDAGRLARASIGRQDVSDGVLTIDVTEARFGQVRAEGADGDGWVGRLQAARIVALAQSAQPTGTLFDQAALDRRLLLLDDWPGVSVQGRLAPGANDGETDLVLSLSPEPTLATTVAADNAGSRAVGAQRVHLQAQLASPLRLGDAAQLGASIGEGSQSLRLAWQAPVPLPGAALGWRMGLHGSWLIYKVVAPEMKALDAKGSSTAWGLDAQWALLRSRRANAQLALGHEWRQFDNRAGGVTVSRHRLNIATLALAGQRQDEWLAGGTSSGSVNLGLGRVDLAGAPEQAADAAGVRTGGGFQRLQLQLGRKQALDDRTLLLANFSAQWASRNLDSSERMTLGGLQGVRAYPTGEGSGSEGALLNVELRRRLTSTWSVSTFVDHGQTTLFKTPTAANGSPLLAGRNRYSLSGAGIGVEWESERGPVVKAAWAHALGSHPAATPDGRNQDGSSGRQRLWLAASVDL